MYDETFSSECYEQRVCNNEVRHAKSFRSVGYASVKKTKSTEDQNLTLFNLIRWRACEFTASFDPRAPSRLFPSFLSCMAATPAAKQRPSSPAASGSLTSAACLQTSEMLSASIIQNIIFSPILDKEHGGGPEVGRLVRKIESAAARDSSVDANQDHPFFQSWHVFSFV